MATKTVTKSLGGIEDLLLGEEIRTQSRAGQTVNVTGLAGSTIPLAGANSETIEEAVSSMGSDLAELSTEVAITAGKAAHNFIMNGRFDIWQRSNTFSGTGFGAADRWTALRVDSTLDQSRQAFDVGQTVVPGNPSYFHRSVVVHNDGSANSALIGQPIESASTGANLTVTLSYWAKASTAGLKIANEFTQIFDPTTGDPDGTNPVQGIGVSSHVLTTSWQKYTATVTLPPLTPGQAYDNSTSYVGVIFWFDANSQYDSRTNGLGAQTGTFDIAQVQVEAGPTATTMQIRSRALELALCQRYYQEGTIEWRGLTDSNINQGYRQTLPVTMRVAPSIAKEEIDIEENVVSTSLVSPSRTSIGITSRGQTSGEARVHINYNLYAELAVPVDA